MSNLLFTFNAFSFFFVNVISSRIEIYIRFAAAVGECVIGIY